MNTNTSKISPLREPVAVAPTQGTLALDLSPRLDPPVARGPEAPRGGDVVPIDSRVRRKLEGWSYRYVESAVQIVNGDRPVSQLVRWSSRRVHEELTRRAQIVARAGVHRAGLGRGRRPLVTPRVHRVHTSFVSPGIAEACATVKYGDRFRAVALRFEHLEGRWICTALEFA